MAETLYNFTVADTSPMLVYSPYVAGDATTGGWQSLCPTYVTGATGQNSYMCDPDSVHTTSSYKASLQLAFQGVGVSLIGNTTNSLGYDITLDGTTFPGNPKPDDQVLFSTSGLSPGSHSITLTVRQPPSSASPGSVTFKEAVVVAGTGLSGATVTKQVLDDGDSSIAYAAPPGGNWTVEVTYPQSIGPEGISSTTFHDSYWTGATATVNFQGTGIFVYGACYSHSRYAAYSASVDGAAASSFDGTVNLFSSDGLVKQRAGNCLRYFKTGLDNTRDHQLVLRVKDAGRLAVDWVEVMTVSGGTATDTGSRGNATSSHSSVSPAILAGAIAGGVVLILTLLAIAIFLRRRKHNTIQVEDNKVQFNETSTYATTPFTLSSQQPNSASSYDGSGMVQMPFTPPWPQPQSPAPGADGINYMMHSPGPMHANRKSFASSSAPLLSPGIASAYSGSSGPGSPLGGPMLGGENTIFRPMPVRAGDSAASGSNMPIEVVPIREDMMSPSPPAYEQGSFLVPSPAPKSFQG